MKNTEKVYHGISKDRIEAYYTMYFEVNEDVPKCIKKIMKQFNNLFFKTSNFKITKVNIDYDLKMVDVIYIT